MSFRERLAELVERVPSCRGAIFCDFEGENVDFALREPPPDGAPPLSDYDMKVAGAQLAAQWILFREKGAPHGAGEPVALRMHMPSGTLLCHSVKDGYYVVLLLSHRALTAVAAQQLAEMARVFALDM